MNQVVHPPAAWQVPVWHRSGFWIPPKKIPRKKKLKKKHEFQELASWQPSCCHFFDFCSDLSEDMMRDSEKHMEKVVIYRAKMPSTSAENNAALGRDQSCNGLSIYQCRFPLVLLPRIETKLTKTSAANNQLRHLQECSNPASAAILTENLCELSCLLCGVVGWELVVQFYPKNNANTERVFAEQVLAKKNLFECF